MKQTDWCPTSTNGSKDYDLDGALSVASLHQTKSSEEKKEEDRHSMVDGYLLERCISLVAVCGVRL